MQDVPYKEFQKYLGPIRPCLICKDDTDGKTRKVWATDEYFTALQCNACGIITIDPGLTEEGLQIYYQNNMGRRLDQKKKLEDRKIQYKIDSNILEKFIKQGKVLDVGCGGGYFLSVLSDNFDKYGIDIDKESIKHGKERFSYNFRCEIIGQDSFSESFFDLIIFRGVIEHMYDPKTALDRAWSLLKPGGKLFFCATPNVDSFCAHIYREKWNLWHPIQHINHFSIETLYKLCGTDRYKIIDIDYPYLGTPYESQENDYEEIIKDIKQMNGKENSIKKVNPPFWGNMLSLLLEKH